MDMNIYEIGKVLVSLITSGVTSNNTVFVLKSLQITMEIFDS